MIKGNTYSFGCIIVINNQKEIMNKLSSFTEKKIIYYNLAIKIYSNGYIDFLFSNLDLTNIDNLTSQINNLKHFVKQRYYIEQNVLYFTKNVDNKNNSYLTNVMNSSRKQLLSIIQYLDFTIHVISLDTYENTLLDVCIENNYIIHPKKDNINNINYKKIINDLLPIIFTKIDVVNI